MSTITNREIYRTRKVLEKKILALLELDLGEYEFRRRLKPIIQQSEIKIKEAQIKSIYAQYKEGLKVKLFVNNVDGKAGKWLDIDEKKGVFSNDTKNLSFSIEIVEPEEIVKKNIPYVAKTVQQKTDAANNLNMNRIVGQLYKDSIKLRDVSKKLQNVFEDYRTKDVSSAQLTQNLRDALGKFENYANTISNTYMACIERNQHVARGESLGLEYFQFAHTSPERPFCKQFANIILHKEVWVKLDTMDLGIEGMKAGVLGNGQGEDLPILASGGGFNCKGDMRPVTKKMYEAYKKDNPEQYKFLETLGIQA